MKLILLFLYFTAAHANTQKFQVDLVLQDKSCQNFIKNIKTCKPEKCSYQIKNQEGAEKKFELEIGSKLNSESCEISFGENDKKKSMISKVELNNVQRGQLADYLAEVLKNKKFSVESEQLCCAKNLKEITFCDIKINNKIFKKITDPNPYFDCQGKNVFKIETKITNK